MISDKVKRILKVLVLSVILIAVMVLFTQTLGLAGKGFDTQEVQSQFFFYVAPGIAFLVGVLIFFVIELFITNKDNLYGNGNAYADQGEFPSLSFFKKYGAFQIFLISVIIFGILGTFIFVTGQQTFTGVKVLQQFTPVNSLTFSSLLVPASENLGAAFFIGLCLLALRYYSRKWNLDKFSFRLFSLLGIPFVIGLYGVANHILRYSSSDTALWVVFGFWTIGGFVTMITGSFIPFWVMHIFNNAFFDLKRLFDKDIVIFSLVTIIIVLCIMYYFLYIRKSKNKKLEKNINNI